MDVKGAWQWTERLDMKEKLIVLTKKVEVFGIR